MDEDAAVLTSYFRERHSAGAAVLGRALMDRYRHRQVAAGVLLRGIEGYGPGRSPADDRGRCRYQAADRGTA